MKNGIKDLAGTIIMMWQDLVEWFKENKKSILRFLNSFLFVIMTMVIIMFWDEEILKKFICWIFLYLIHELFNLAFIYDDKKKLPRVNKRFTKITSDGVVKVKAEEFQQAILFLYDVENYLGK